MFQYCEGNLIHGGCTVERRVNVSTVVVVHCCEGAYTGCLKKIVRRLIKY